jgi:hypothetical protein
VLGGVDRFIAPAGSSAATDCAERWVRRAEIAAAIVSVLERERPNSPKPSTVTTSTRRSCCRSSGSSIRDPHAGDIDAIENDLPIGGFVYRYLAPDGLAGEEGTFPLRTFWLARGLAGRLNGRRTLRAGHLPAPMTSGLAEEVTPESGELLGTSPAFSHVGLINGVGDQPGGGLT